MLGKRREKAVTHHITCSFRHDVIVIEVLLDASIVVHHGWALNRIEPEPCIASGHDWPLDVLV